MGQKVKHEIGVTDFYPNMFMGPFTITEWDERELSLILFSW